MRLCLDTRFLVEVANKNERQVRLFERIASGDHIAFLPTVCISEFSKVCHKSGRTDNIDSICLKLKRLSMIYSIGLSYKIAISSGELQFKYGMGLGDSIVAATAINNECRYIVTDDPDFERIRHLIKTKFGFC